MMRIEIQLGIILTTCAAAMTSAAKTTLPRLESVSTNVPGGVSASLESPIEASGESRLVKTGEGTLTVPSRIGLPASVPVDVGAGTVVVGGGETMGEVVAPDVIRQSAAFWVASDTQMANFDTETQGEKECVSLWRDVRDTVASSTNYPFLVVHPDVVKGGQAKSFVPPYTRTVDGKRTVYFRGWGSRCAMQVRSAAGEKTSLDVGSVFFVTSVSNTWGYLLGDADDIGSYHIGGGYESGAISNTYYSARRDPAIRSARFYDNGERRDSQSGIVKAGMHIIEFHHPGNALAKSGNMMFGWSPDRVDREGGDDMMELIVFSSPLAEADRLAVLRYLAAKWSADRGRLLLRTAKGVSIDVAASGEVLASGEGVYRATANGVTFTTGKETFFGGLVDAQAGCTATNNSPALAFSIEDGETLNAERANEKLYGRMPFSLTEDAPAGTVVKTGTGAVRITELPQTVSKFEVRGGRVTLAPPMRTRARVPQTGANDIHATIPNANFESDDMSAWTMYGDKATRWRRKSGADTWISDHDTPDGDWVLVLKSSSAKEPWAAVTVTVPVTGHYELSFLGDGRQNWGVGKFSISFVRDAVTNTCDDVFVFAYASNIGYARHRLLTPELEAGEWTMRIAADVTGDSTSTFDDFKMKLVTEDLNLDGAWRIPNGGFENVLRGGFKSRSVNWGACSLTDFTMAASNMVASWSFTQGGDGTSGAPSVGLSHAAMSANGYGYFHNANLDRFGDSCMAFYSNGGTATSAAFTPPAGRYRLRFKSAFAGFDQRQWHGKSLNNNPVWEATVIVNGGEPQSLGTASGALSGFNTWGEVTLPAEFVVPEGASVAVSIRQTAEAGAGFLDDVELVPDNNLVADGGFENATWSDASAWQRSIPGLGDRANKNADSYVARWEYANQPQYFGYDMYEGGYCLKLWSMKEDAAWQDVGVPSNGLYRLTFHARTRVDSRFLSPTYNASYARNPIRVWMAQGGVTNEIGRTDVDYDEFRPYHYFWRAPAAGTYRLGFQSTLPAFEDRSTMIDGVSLTPVGEELVSDTPDLPRGMSLNIATGAQVALDFAGTVKLDALRIAGKSYTGTVDASTVPGVIFGQGRMEVKSKGFILTFR